MGLARARRYVVAQAGRSGIESQPVQGPAVCVDLPLAGSSALALPSLVEKVEKRLEGHAARRSAARERFDRLSKKRSELQAGWE